MAMADDFHVWFHPCTVRITLANGVCGTGFFAAPGYVVTCEHVVREAGQGPITLGWQGQEGFAQAELLRVLPDHDLALLRFRPPDQVPLPWVWLDADLQVGDRLYTFGYPAQDYTQGRPATVEMEGVLEDSFLLLKQGQLQPGMSGGPLLNQRTGKVCGMAKFTRDQFTDLGGGGVQGRVILQQLPELREGQAAFEQGSQVWLGLPEPPTHSLKAPTNLPRRGTDYFVGRASDLKRLHQQLQAHSHVAITALVGMGGLGKTELALQYGRSAEAQAAYPGGQCWLEARDQEVALQILTFAAVHLHHTPSEELPLAARVESCWQHWPDFGEPKAQALVIIDDVSDYSTLAPYLPKDSRFTLLFTTRQQRLAATVTDLPLEVLTPEAARQLLESLAGLARLQAEPEMAVALCADLGYLPLALELVGRYLQKKPDLSLTELRQRLAAQALQARSLSRPEPGMTHSQGVADAFELSWQDLEPEAQALAQSLSCFARAPIPWAPVVACWPEADTEDLEDWRDQLVKASLLQRQELGVYRYHPLVHGFVRSKLAPDSPLVRAYAKAMAAAAKEIEDTPTLEQVQAWSPLVPHMAEAATQWPVALADDDLTWPFVGLGRFYKGQGLYPEAALWCEKCLEVARQQLGERHPDVATSLNNLALLYYAQGRYEEAEPLYRQALELRRELLGERHPDVATSLNNLANLYESQGRYEEAEPLYKQDLTISRELLGESHPDVATSLNNLANLYESQGRYGEAEPLYKKALKLRQALLGERHPHFAGSLNNLAGLYESQGRYEEAEPLYCQALELRRELLGERHPDVATSLNNLANLYMSQGRYEEAEPLYKQDLTISRELLGEHHPDVATSLHNLAELYRTQGRYNTAEPLYQQALALYRELLGERHPHVAQSLNNLAELYRAQGRYKKAKLLHHKALQLRCELLGDRHPAVAQSLNNLACLYELYKHYEQAETLYLQTLNILTESVGPDHPNFQISFQNFVTFLQKVVEANQTHRLSDHPLVQSVLSQMGTR